MPSRSCAFHSAACWHELVGLLASHAQPDVAPDVAGRLLRREASSGAGPPAAGRATESAVRRSIVASVAYEGARATRRELAAQAPEISACADLELVRAHARDFGPGRM